MRSAQLIPFQRHKAPKPLPRITPLKFSPDNDWKAHRRRNSPLKLNASLHEIYKRYSNDELDYVNAYHEDFEPYRSHADYIHGRHQKQLTEIRRFIDESGPTKKGKPESNVQWRKSSLRFKPASRKVYGDEEASPPITPEAQDYRQAKVSPKTSTDRGNGDQTTSKRFTAKCESVNIPRESSFICGDSTHIPQYRVNVGGTIERHDLTKERKYEEGRSPDRKPSSKSHKSRCHSKDETGPHSTSDSFSNRDVSSTNKSSSSRIPQQLVLPDYRSWTVSQSYRPVGGVSLYTNQGSQLMMEMKNRLRKKYGETEERIEPLPQSKSSPEHIDPFDLPEPGKVQLDGPQELSPLPNGLDNDMSHILPCVIKARPKQSSKHTNRSGSCELNHENQRNLRPDPSF